MKYYAKFLIVDNNGDIVEAMGADSVYALDGRKTLYNMKLDIFNRLYRLRAVQPKYVGYKLYKGNTVLREFDTRRTKIESSVYFK